MKIDKRSKLNTQNQIKRVVKVAPTKNQTILLFLT